MDQKTKDLIEDVVNTLVDDHDGGDVEEVESAYNASRGLEEVRRAFYGTPLEEKFTDMIGILSHVINSVKSHQG